MGDRVFIARQDTLEAVRGNTDGEILPALWIAEYKLHGENSYVFRDADVLGRMYRSTAAVNDPQINGEALEYILMHGESLSGWLMQLSDTRANGQVLFAGIETAEHLAGNKGALAAVMQSETAMMALLGNETVMTALGMSETAMNLICADKAVLEKVMQSEHFRKTMQEKNMSAAKLTAALIGIAFETITGFSGIVSNAEAIQAVTLNIDAMAFAAGSPDAMNEIAADAGAREKVRVSEYYGETIGANDMSAAKILAALAGLEVNTVSGMADITENADSMGLFAASKNLLGAAAENMAAIRAIEESEAAIAVLNASPLIQTANYPIEHTWKVRREGRVFLIGFMQSKYGGTNTIYAGHAIMGNGSVNATTQDSLGEFAPINRFLNGISNYWNSTSELTVAYKFIPID